MLASSITWLAILSSVQLVHSYVEFGTVTAPCNFELIFDVPRPKFVPEDAYMRYEPYSSSITAVAPSLRLGSNGTHETSWSLHFVEQPTRTTATRDGDLRRRGVFSGDPAIPTCRPCDRSGNPLDNGSNSNATNTDGTPNCSVTNYDGVFRDGVPTSSDLPSYCFNSGYTGPLVPTPVPTDAGLPCCPVCYPPNTNGTTGTNGTNTSFTATTGVFSPTTTPRISRSTTSKAVPGSDGGKDTVTVTATATRPITITQTTLSIETITPTGNPESPIVTTELNTIIGCGTARGCGTVIGSGTVYLPPFGFPAVTSSGTVSGCAPTVIGCGTMIATSGTFTAPPDSPATITACGEGTGSATLIGSGTVWPAGFKDLISFVSSGTLTGSGRVKGCGTIYGYGTFTVGRPYTATRTGEPTTVNVYVSYCPEDFGGSLIGVGGGAGLRLSGNFTGDDDSPPLINPHADDDDEDDTNPNRYALSAISPYGNNTSSYPYNNSTSNNTTLTNGLCNTCPQDSGICCPRNTACGDDGHCPWTALEGCGYALHGFNIVNMLNSSGTLGMSAGGMRKKAPGLPGSGGDSGDGIDISGSEDHKQDDNGNGNGATATRTDETNDPNTATSSDSNSNTSPPDQPSQPDPTPSALVSTSSFTKERRLKRQPSAENAGRRPGQRDTHVHEHAQAHKRGLGHPHRFGFAALHAD